MKPRAARADACTDNMIVLLKNVSTLRLTYQIRLLTFQAFEEKKRLVVEVPHRCNIHISLSEFARAFKEHISVVKV